MEESGGAMDILVDMACLLIIIIFVRMMNGISYERESREYMENQFGLIASSSISCLLVMRAYYYLESKYQIDAMYTNGIILTSALLIGGMISELMYKHYFYREDSRYSPTDKEYLFIVSMSFLAVSIKMVSENVIEITIPVALLLGRFVWLDTRSIMSIKDAVEVRHMRIVESSVLILIGMALLSVVSYQLHIERYVEIFVSLGYGLIVLVPYKYIRDKVKKCNK